MVFLLYSVFFFVLKGLWQVICLFWRLLLSMKVVFFLDIIFLKLFVLFGGCWNLFFAWVFPFSSPFYWAWSVLVEYIFFPLFVDLSLRPYLFRLFSFFNGSSFLSEFGTWCLNFMVHFALVNPFNCWILIFRARKY